MHILSASLTSDLLPVAKLIGLARYCVPDYISYFMNPLRWVDFLHPLLNFNEDKNKKKHLSLRLVWSREIENSASH